MASLVAESLGVAVGYSAPARPAVTDTNGMCESNPERAARWLARELAVATTRRPRGARLRRGVRAERPPEMTYIVQ
jgi:hypothetical protein